MRVLVTGSRDFDGFAMVERVVGSLYRQKHLRGDPVVIIEGEARGADRFARIAATRYGIPVEPYPVSDQDWKKFGKGAGFRRNLAMLRDGNPDLCIAFSDAILESKGTFQMVSLVVEENDRRAALDPQARMIPIRIFTSTHEIPFDPDLFRPDRPRMQERLDM